MICAIFDALVLGYFHDVPLPDADDRPRREKYIVMEIRGAEEAAASKEGFSKMADAATGIGFSRMEFLTELSTRTGFGEQVMNWAQGTIPNGWVRRIILENAEDILCERGAQPKQTMKEAA